MPHVPSCLDQHVIEDSRHIVLSNAPKIGVQWLDNDTCKPILLLYLGPELLELGCDCVCGADLAVSLHRSWNTSCLSTVPQTGAFSCKGLSD